MRSSIQQSNRPSSSGANVMAAYFLLAVAVVAITVLGTTHILTRSTVMSTPVEATPHTQQLAQSSEPRPNQPLVLPPNSPLPTPTPQQVLLPTVTPDTLLAADSVAATAIDPTPNPTQIPEQSGVFLPEAVIALPDSVTLSGITHEWQTWNNCGPATLSMALSFHGYQLSQAEIGSVLRTNANDKNVNPQELVTYAQLQGLSALARVNGDAQLLKRLVSIGLPVIVEVWLEPEPDNGFGHFRLMTGYDDDSQLWTAYDSYVAENMVDPNGEYSGIYVPYEQLEQQWRVFNRSYIVLYPSDASAQVEAALAGATDDGFMWRQTLARAEIELTQQPDDVFAWFNRGTALVGLEQFKEAANAYDRAQEIGLPWRMMWYQFGPLKAYHETLRHQDLLDTAERTLATTVDVEELYYWQGVALAALGDTEGARTAFRSALALRPDYPEAEQALNALNQ